jgi:hypothetical protein
MLLSDTSLNINSKQVQQDSVAPMKLPGQQQTASKTTDTLPAFITAIRVYLLQLGSKYLLAVLFSPTAPTVCVRWTCIQMVSLHELHVVMFTHKVVVAIFSTPASTNGVDVAHKINQDGLETQIEFKCILLGRVVLLNEILYRTRYIRDSTQALLFLRLIQGFAFAPKTMQFALFPVDQSSST